MQEEHETELTVADVLRRYSRPTRAMIEVGADTLLSCLAEYKNDIHGFAGQIALDIYASMISHEDAPQ